MDSIKIILALAVWFVSGCKTLAQNINIDSSLEREIHNVLKKYPENLASNNESAFILVKVLLTTNNNIKISAVNNSNENLVSYIIENLRKVRFDKYVQNNEALLIPIFFLDIDSYDKNENNLKVDKLSFDIVDQSEKSFEKIVLMRPFKIISPSTKRTQ